MRRYLSDFIAKDLGKKVILLSGPRQVGKTWLSRALCPEDQTVYLNFDRAGDRRVISEESWDRKAHLVIFDELHKKKGWKSWIKGIYDTEGTSPALLVTGSARFDAFRRGGRESLAGRHFSYRLHPLSIAELKSHFDPTTAMERLCERGGFPEPFLGESDTDAARWRRSHLDAILREDLRDLVVIQDLRSVEYLVDRLASQVGSPVSYQSLAEDVGVSAPTIKRWMQALEAMFVIFVLHPWSRKIKGAILKQPKVYFFDTGRIPEAQKAARFENLVACSLLKRAQFLEDTEGAKCELFYLRDKQKREVDFLVVRSSKPEWMIECKLGSQDKPNFNAFEPVEPTSGCILLSRDATHDETRTGYSLYRAAPWLAQLEA